MTRPLLPAALLAILTTVASAAESPARTHQDWRRAAAAARERGDYPAFLAATQAALALRPDSPRYLAGVAGAWVLNGQPDQALGALHRLVDLDVTLPLERLPDLAPLRDTPAFREIVAAMAAHGRPRGHASLAFALPGMSGIIEGIAVRPTTGETFLGDVHQRCVWRRAADGTVTRFSRPDAALEGVFKVAVDEAGHRLWLSTSALPEIAGYSPDLKGHGALCALDLTSGAVVGRYPLPADGLDHCLGDFLVAPDGTIYLPDSLAPVIWRLPPGGDHLERWCSDPRFASLQGVGLVDQGRRLIVSDYSNGLWVLELASGRITPVAPRPDATLLGLDGLVVRGNSLLAVQNGIEPQRVVRLTLATGFDAIAAVEVLAAALPNFDDLTLLAPDGDQLLVVAQSGWAGYDDPKTPPAPHEVRVMRLDLP